MLTVVILLLLLLLSFSIFEIHANVACTTNTYCQNQSPTSKCINGVCTNPYVSHCLTTTKKRVCNSLDDPGSTICVENELKYPEIQIFPHNWEAAMFLSWAVQIFLSEVLMVPVTIELGNKAKNMEFYSPKNTFDFGVDAYLFDALKEPQKTMDGSCPSQKNDDSKEYIPCAHAMLEIWPSGQRDNMRIAFDKTNGYAENGGSNGAYGKISWYTFESYVAKDPALKSFYGYQDRNKMAKMFKRPVSYKEYCANYSTTSCNPSNADKEKYFISGGVYNGYFVADNCTENPQTCAGHFIQSPCTWVTWVDSQIRYANPNGSLALKLSGPLPNGGYSYSQMLQVLEAAGANNENILFWWWSPESMLSRHNIDSKWKLTTIILPDFSLECQQSRPPRMDVCSSNKTIRSGTNRK